MKKTIFTIILSLLLALSASYAANNFTVNTSSLSDRLDIGESESSSIEIENTASSQLNLTLSTSSDNEISSFSVNNSDITLSTGETKSIGVDYTAGNTRGNYLGEISIQDENSNDEETINLSLQILGPELTFFEDDGDELDDNTLEFNGETDDTISETFILRNTGDFDIENIEFNFDVDSELNEDDILVNGDEWDGEFEITSLNTGDEEEVEIEFDLDNTEAEDYDNENLEIDYNYENSNGNSQAKTDSFDLEVDVTSDEEDVFIDNSEPIRIFGEAGENLDDIEIDIENDGNNDVDDLELAVDEDFEERNSANTFDQDNFDLPSSIDVRDDDTETVDIEIDIPDDQPQGVYVGELKLLNSQGDELDAIRTEVRVIGDIYIQNIDYPDEVNPGQRIDVEVTLRNQGSKTYRNVKLDGFLYNTNRDGEDLDDSTSTFLMSAGDEVTKTLRFRIPEDATDGAKTLETTLSYDQSSISEVDSIEVLRPLYNLNIVSHNINPRVVTCQDSIYTYLDVENLGRVDENIRISSSIEGTDIQTQSNLLDLDVDERTEQTLNLFVSDLEPGTYNVELKASGSRSVSETMQLQVNQCNGGGIDVNASQPPTNTTGNQTQENGENTVPFFGQEIDRTTAILGTTLAGIVLLIIVSLFFL